jgi:hypothetical protein
LLAHDEPEQVAVFAGFKVAPPAAKAPPDIFFERATFSPTPLSVMGPSSRPLSKQERYKFDGLLNQGVSDDRFAVFPALASTLLAHTLARLRRLVVEETISMG